MQRCCSWGAASEKNREMQQSDVQVATAVEQRAWSSCDAMGSSVQEGAADVRGNVQEKTTE